MNLKEIGSKRDSLAAKYKWGLMALVALIVSPIIFLVVKGLVGLAIAAVVGIEIDDDTAENHLTSPQAVLEYVAGIKNVPIPAATGENGTSA